MTLRTHVLPIYCLLRGNARNILGGIVLSPLFPPNHGENHNNQH